MEKPKKLSLVPIGYSTYVTSAGIKDKSLDLGVVFSEVPAKAVALFTKNKICGNPIKVAKKHIKQKKVQALVVNSKNSNVATGKEGYEACVNLCAFVAQKLKIKPNLVFPSSTGVIGRRFPIEKILNALNHLPEKLLKPPDFESFAQAIMTTDTFPKWAERKIGKSTLIGVAKGSGMIAPNMATLLAFFFTDADLPYTYLKYTFKKIIDKTFNSLSIDGDTSTSDTALIMANGLAGKVNPKEFREALLSLAEELALYLARDGEGATKVLVVDVIGAKNDKEAHKIGLSIINSPLVKTAIYKGDPNWGRIFMAIGKTPKVTVKESQIKLFWGKDKIGVDDLKKLQDYLQKEEILELTVDLGIGNGKSRVFGCDLTEEYVRINAYYTT